MLQNYTVRNKRQREHLLLSLSRKTDGLELTDSRWTAASPPQQELCEDCCQETEGEHASFHSFTS